MMYILSICKITVDLITCLLYTSLVEGSIIEINVTTPEGKNYCTNVKLKADDMELFDSFKNMQG